MDSRYSNISVVVYFSGGMGNVYQLDQWIKPLEVLNKTEEVLIVARNVEVYEWIQAHTQFHVAFCKTMTTLLQLYEDNNFKCILYVNNSCTNFQSLSDNRALHVHINHGESEKTSTFTNRAKAYDYTFVVADAGYDKYMNNLINIDPSKFVKIGRPQTDFVALIDRPVTDKKIILYAPTWEGTHLSMNYTSLPDCGMTFVKKILATNDYYLIYRPHPNTGSRDLVTKQTDNEIRDLVAKSDSATLMIEEDINSVFELVDLAIFDNSAVTVDFLAFDKPMLMTDYFHRQKGMVAGKPQIIKACELINDQNSENIVALIADSLKQDSKATQRREVKQYFLGDYPRGKSTEKFVEKVMEVIDMRDELLLCNSQNDDVIPFTSSIMG